MFNSGLYHGTFYKREVTVHLISVYPVYMNVGGRRICVGVVSRDSPNAARRRIRTTLLPHDRDDSEVEVLGPQSDEGGFNLFERGYPPDELPPYVDEALQDRQGQLLDDEQMCEKESWEEGTWRAHDDVPEELPADDPEFDNIDAPDRHGYDFLAEDLQRRFDKSRQKFLKAKADSSWSLDEIPRSWKQPKTGVRVCGGKWEFSRLEGWTEKLQAEGRKLEQKQDALVKDEAGLELELKHLELNGDQLELMLEDFAQKRKLLKQKGTVLSGSAERFEQLLKRIDVRRKLLKCRRVGLRQKVFLLDQERQLLENDSRELFRRWRRPVRLRTQHRPGGTPSARLLSTKLAEAEANECVKGICLPVSVSEGIERYRAWRKQNRELFSAN